MSALLVISNATDLLRVDPADVVAVKAEGNYSYVVLADGDERLVAFQLGHVADMITRQLGAAAQAFIRVGRSVIINRRYIFAINLPHLQLTLRSAQGFKCTVSASRDSLRQLKDFVETTSNMETTE